MTESRSVFTWSGTGGLAAEVNEGIYQCDVTIELNPMETVHLK
jgi:hypothetical protein